MPESAGAVHVYATPSRAALFRELLSAACRATGIGARLELHATGILFRHLATQREAPSADLVLGGGPYMAQAAAADGLLQPHQPRSWSGAPSPPGALATHERWWRWTAIAFAPFSVAGQPPVASLDQLEGMTAPRLALPDPARSEVGLMALLATLDRARQAEGDPERGWAWWLARVRAGVELRDDPASAAAALADGRATHVLSDAPGGAPLRGLAPMPDVAGVVAGASRADQARRLLDWLAGPDAAAVATAGGAYALWQAERSGLRQLAEAAPPLDVEWTVQQYRPARQRWTASGLSPAVSA